MIGMGNEPSALAILIKLLIPSVFFTIIFMFTEPIISVGIVLIWVVVFVSIMMYDSRHWGRPIPDTQGLLLSTKTRNIGLGEYAAGELVMGSCIKTRNIFSTARAEARSLVGGEATQFTALVEECRNIALTRMCRAARDMGCNGVVGFRMTTAETLWGATEIIAFGTAVTFNSD